MNVLILFLAHLVFIKCQYEIFENTRADQDDPKLFHGYLFKKFTQTLPDIIQRWKIFKAKLKLRFSTEENRARFFSYAKNAIFIYEFMKENSSTFEVGENQFTHLTREEYFYRLGTFIPGAVDSTTQEIQPELETRQEVQTTIDWRTKKVVTPVKDQGYCGSCYAFATISALESAMMIKNKKTIPDLSEQQIVDCGHQTGNYGCDGGFLEYTFDYMRSTSLATEADYPYTGEMGTCRRAPEYAAKVTNYYRVRIGDEKDLANTLLTKGPITIAVDSRANTFMLYKSGIYKDKSCTSDGLTHAVTLVGMREKHYIIKNSWGTDWGIEGYIHIARNENNMCGVASWAVIPFI